VSERMGLLGILVALGLLIWLASERALGILPHMAKRSFAA
jgi:hypothetical protein